ncbi:hypothetical protein GobsT_05110 [Gemmata obscuriglobus]|uniref:Uncharacterized protein n=1 Tax=Gemmata obscuriglobus TaxID=114 RepID=A0A2Z3HHL1_9BACT|nr:hypothetical protein [Gemmata obscuriglobus]AWM40920.1 hypothetical protein C1280_30635 [Gemmata obscuriglobus]QEG25776.1 hypothetical protein GobsT_05110 [Gemmata obscuriglobus]VTR99607.1 Uncharacterized protein OS=Thioploca ingrica GN=THII_0525 PE=4 SV=1 [Gemmata obscuriglobus UQM 2246]
MSRTLLAFACWLTFAPAVLGQPAAGGPRKLLYPAAPADVPAVLRPHVEKLLATDQKPLDPGAAKADGVYLRVLSRQYAVDADLKPAGWLGTRPVVFLTVPETAYGRDLLGVLSAIGYDPEDIIDAETGVEKVAVVFAYPDTVREADPKADAVPDDWDRRVFPSTWDNLFALADRSTSDKERFAVRPEGDRFQPTKFQFRSEKEAAFIASFPDAGKKRVRAIEYAALRDAGGADWVYRQSVERLFGASEHYTGDGRTKLTLAGKKKPRAGFPEFLAPNAELKGLPAVAVVSLGALRVSDK